ncbi:tetratricopeptide repeat-containing diguanylate cyclase [Pseudoalteromonas luteoviolacea]|uniref:tetratricopeptide repeat-containing diguanylate cyclase n=1 Tax=Pseudoalteromonas luteoviolacea TaxID=43657 RepID=UPI001B364655|nr:GGDEF domain-containing protein [Pseudoalteromonas luteoviolacea]MBQ4836263.1 GGDEF domain-containing protein [Pseudoalteromonas luteoviolacea]
MKKELLLIVSYWLLSVSAWANINTEATPSQREDLSKMLLHLTDSLEEDYDLNLLPQVRVLREQSRQLGEKHLQARSLLLEGLIRQHFGDYKHSLVLHNDALAIAKNLDSPILEVQIYLALAQLEMDLERFRYAQQLLSRAYTLITTRIDAEQSKKLMGEYVLWQGSLYLLKGSYRQALATLSKHSLSEFRGLSSKLALARAWAYLSIGAYPKARLLMNSNYINKSELSQNLHLRVRYQLMNATAYLQAGEFTSAIHTAKLALNETFGTRFLTEQSKLQKVLAGAYAQLGDFEQAHLYLKRFALSQQALNLQKRNNKLLQLEAQYSLAAQKQQLSVLEKDNALQAQQLIQHQQQIDNAHLAQQRGVLGLLLIALVLGFGYWRWQNKRYLITLKQQVAERTAELAERNKRLQALSFTDSLTGLNNRHYFFSVIDAQIKPQSSPQSEKQEMIFCLLDIDHFKKVNDTYGHAAGDLVLQTVADILKQCTREGDLVIRWGGEEFLIVMPNMTHNEAIEAVERVRRQVECFPFVVNEQAIQVTCSIGFAPYPLTNGANKSLSWEQVIELADNGLYMAKKEHRNAWVGLHRLNHPLNCSIKHLNKDYRSLINSGQVTASVSYQT